MCPFDDTSLVMAYDNTIDWDARLAREMPFLLATTTGSHGLRALDLACGSGRHAIALAKHGADVLALDSSTAMIDRANTLATEAGVSPVFLTQDMLLLSSHVPGSFDLITCLGNSLALVPTVSDFDQLVTNISEKLAPTGTFVFQILNFETLVRSNDRFFPPRSGRLASGEDVVFVRFYDRLDAGAVSTLVLASFVNTGSEWIPHVSYQQVLHLEYDHILQTLEEAGLIKVEAFSDYSMTPFNRATDRNLVVRASHG
jgi:2-polyprenyl-3-methyl-5-hydroxy-6-metoxy-1,4-benzoquinol methylase